MTKKISDVEKFIRKTKRQQQRKNDETRNDAPYTRHYMNHFTEVITFCGLDMRTDTKENKGHSMVAHESIVSCDVCLDLLKQNRENTEPIKEQKAA